MDVVSGEVGPEVKYGLKVEGLKLKFDLHRQGAMGDEEGIYGSLPLDAVLKVVGDEGKKLLPPIMHPFIDMGINMLLGAISK